ncbi:transposase [Solimonas sp. SE-A11]|uniref:transposase n=1 Tax=Solimonas sp. SE-A11 TaxID=3054954 RepID=UPI003460409A
MRQAAHRRSGRRRGDAGGSRADRPDPHALMHWCETNRADYILGLARNARLTRAISVSMQQANEQHQATGRSARVFQELTYRTRKSWSATRSVVAKAEVLPGKTNLRFVVTSLSRQDWVARALYEDLYCARGEMENRIKQCQLDLFADCTSTATLENNTGRRARAAVRSGV